MTMIEMLISVTTLLAVTYAGIGFMASNRFLKEVAKNE